MADGVFWVVVAALVGGVDGGLIGVCLVAAVGCLFFFFFG
jgi:hypothetical protein